MPTVCLSHLSPTQVKAYILADNKLALNAGWDNDMLKVELEDLKDLDFDLNLTGFSDEELKDILVEDPTEAHEDNFDGEPPEVAKSQLGDIWTMGEHRLMCGDSTSENDVKCLMQGELSDLLITDPPYNVAYQGGTKDKLTILNDKQDSDSFRQFLRDAFSAADSVMKPGAVFYVWFSDRESYNFYGAVHDVGWYLSEKLVWVKNSLILGGFDYQMRHEPCLYGWKDGTHLWASDRKQTTVIEMDRPVRNGVHPTMKPVGLFDYQIKNNTRESDVVLDLFGSSGTTLIACEQNGRKSRLMELDPKYVDVIVNRYQTLTGKEAVRQDGIKFNDL